MAQHAPCDGKHMRKTAFMELVRLHKDMVYTMAYYMTGCREDADDVSQNVLIKFWRDFDKIESGAHKAWLLKSTRNGAIDCMRKRKRMRLVSADALNAETSTRSGAEDSRTPESQLLYSERSELLSQLILRLPDAFREIIVLHDIQGLPVRMVAETLDAPENTVKVYLHRARKQLLKMMDPDIRFAIE